MFYCWIAYDKFTKQVVAACGQSNDYPPIENLGKFKDDPDLLFTQLEYPETVDRNFLVADLPDGSKTLVPNPDPNPPPQPPPPIDIAQEIADLKARIGNLESA